MTLIILVKAFFFAVALCLAGEVIRMSLPGLKRILIPGAVIGGSLALLFGPQVLGWHETLGLGQATYDTLGRFPPLFINVVFAALMLGRPIHSFSKIWHRARPQIVMGHVYAWGQYVVGLSLVLFLLGPWLDTDNLAGPTIAIGFQGGHGTAAGLAETFKEFEFAEGKTIAYALATFGIVAGTILGPLLANFHRSRKDKAEEGDESKDPSGHKVGGGDEAPEQEDEKHPVEFSPLTGSLTVQMAIVGIVILIGYWLLEGAKYLEGLIRGDVEQLYAAYVPLFSVVLLAGLGVQLLLQALKIDSLIKRSTIQIISAFALDMVILGALASLDLDVIGGQWQTITALCLVGLGWNLAVFYSLGSRVYPHPWFAYGLGDLGGGTATTASGLLLIRVADPNNNTDAKKAYTEKQPFYEPFMGGGLVTAMALPIVANMGAMAALGITGVILAGWIGFAIWLIRQKS